jgi:hypothetical protein
MAQGGWNGGREHSVQVKGRAWSRGLLREEAGLIVGRCSGPRWALGRLNNLVIGERGCDKRPFLSEIQENSATKRSHLHRQVVRLQLALGSDKKERNWTLAWKTLTCVLSKKVSQLADQHIGPGQNLN